MTIDINAHAIAYFTNWSLQNLATVGPPKTEIQYKTSLSENKQVTINRTKAVSSHEDTSRLKVNVERCAEWCQCHRSCIKLLLPAVFHMIC